ncbi:hypothetical protein GOP47_0023278 [Adiantum capillus-veneris]|uniref:U-box domain-containing protein n=1 Tax=Adiantum capillus-veneris TaxID=13818 RepID=A0A9D4Z645_ADICA|nr:hypothetical protein GOP47_0023278 [Adiantum capillus-veneris]
MPSLIRKSYTAVLGLLSIRIISPSSSHAQEASLPPARANPTDLASPAVKLPLHPHRVEGSTGSIEDRTLCQHHNIKFSSIADRGADDKTAAHMLTSSDSSSCLISTANKSLDIFRQQMPHLNDIQDRISFLDTTCNACSAAAAKPITIDQCIATACIEVIVNLLSHESPLAPPMAMQTEKALLLLDLITTQSEAACTAALQQYSSSVINTLGRKLLRISEACTASAMAILITLCSKSHGAPFRQAILKTAIPSKLVVVLQVASKKSSKQSAGKLLQLLHAHNKQA